jgi:hypothetical protein
VSSDQFDGAGGTDASATSGERVRAAARTLRQPRTASWVADETDTAVKTAQKYLDQLVADGILRRVDRGDTTRYCVDRLMATYREVATLQREHDREELTETLATMRTQITDWKRRYDTDSPDALRASLGSLDDPEEIATRREVASEWEHLTDRVELVQTALAEYDLVENPPVTVE